MKTHNLISARHLTTIGVLVALLVTGCATSNPEAIRHERNLADIHSKSHCKIKTLHRWWSPLPGVETRKDVAFEQVEFLEKEPTDRKFQVIGYFEPNWEVMGQYVNAARGEAALQGADAFYFVDQTNTTVPKHTAAIIVWK